jgi:predicted ester cyclase
MTMQQHNRTFASFILLLAALVLSVLPSLTAAQEDMAAAHKEAILRVTDEAFNQGNFDSLNEFVATDYVQHSSGGDIDLEAFVADIQAQRAAFTDYHLATEIMVAEGDWVASRFIISGVFENELAFTGGDPIPPTGQPVSYAVHVFTRFNEEGKDVEDFVIINVLDFLMQLGAFPPPEGAPPPEAVEEAVVEMMEVGATGMEEAHTETIERLTAEVFNQGKMEVMGELFAADYVAHDAGGATSDLEAFTAFLSAIFTAIPDFTLTAEAMVAEGDWVAVLYSAAGTLTGELQLPDGSRVPPNNGAIGLPQVIFFRFNEEGKIAEAWERHDNLSFLQQLGVIPMPEAES